MAESLISDDQSDAEEAGADEPDELQDEEAEQTAKRQRIDMTHVNNDATPFSTIQARYSTSLGIDELASAIAEERYEEHQRLLAKQKQDRERAYKNNNTVSFGPSNGNWEMQRRMYKVRNMNSLVREKEKGRGDQPRRRSVRREFVTRSTEERSQILRIRVRFINRNKTKARGFGEDLGSEKNAVSLQISFSIIWQGRSKSVTCVVI